MLIVLHALGVLLGVIQHLHAIRAKLTHNRITGTPHSRPPPADWFDKVWFLKNVQELCLVRLAVAMDSQVSINFSI